MVTVLQLTVEELKADKRRLKKELNEKTNLKPTGLNLKMEKFSHVDEKAKIELCGSLTSRRTLNH